jgi:hypothetical protein
MKSVILSLLICLRDIQEDLEMTFGSSPKSKALPLRPVVTDFMLEPIILHNDSPISSGGYHMLWLSPKITCSISRFPEQIG